MASAIPDNLTAELLAKSGEGLSSSEIANYFNQKYGLLIADSAIRNRLKRIHAERAPITRAIIADKLSKTVGIDLDRIDQAIERALEDELDAREDANETRIVQKPNGETLERVHMSGSDSWSKIMHVVKASRGDLTRLVELRLKLAGADDGSGKRPDAKDVQEKLLQRFEALIEAKKVRGTTVATPSGTVN